MNQNNSRPVGGQVRKMLTAAGGPIYEKDWSDKLEPYAAGVGLAGDAVGLGVAATGVGIPVGTTIAGFANIPNLIIDGYQTARDAVRSYNDNGQSLGSAAWNGGEFILDAAGLKALQYINKAQKAGISAEKLITSAEKKAASPYRRVGTGAGRVRARQSANYKKRYNSRRNKALEESNEYLAKRGVRETQGEYYRLKLANEMAKRGYGIAVNDAIKSVNRTARQNLAAVSTISGGTNVYHLLPKHKSGGLVRKMQTAAGGPIHYSRTMTPENLSKAANYVGGYVLKGLGALGKIFIAPLTGGPMGTNTVPLYPRTVLQANAERKLRETQEELIGKAMTWLSPLNYGVALTTGNGLNAKKGEEEVASWSPAWLAVGRVGELYVGPKAVKGASRVAINTAAKAGSKSAKAAVIAREINKGVNKNAPKHDNRIHSIRVDNLIYDYSSNPLLELANTIRTSPTNSYFMGAPSKIDITKLRNGRFRHEVVGNDILPSGEVDGKFVSYGEPWREFDFSEGSALYEFPVGPKRSPYMMATDWKGRSKDYSVKEVYDYMKLEEHLKKDLRLLKEQMGKELYNKNYATIRNTLIEDKYPLLKLYIDTSVYGSNQTVIPNLKWNFNNFLSSPFYKYTLDPISNQVQKELVISGIPNKPVESSASLAFFERKPKNNIVGTSLDYSMKDTKGIEDFFKLFFALLKINGKIYTLEGLKDASNVQQGLPEYIQSYLNQNTVERAVRAMRKNGYSEREILLYIDKVNEVMNKVKVGVYSDWEYNAAGALGFGGFYNNNTNFISVNKDAYLKDSKFTPEYIMKHEGRHLIDYNTSMTDDVINTLEKAYDKDFLEIPKHEDAGNLKDYLHMDRERVTTNRDARDVLLTSKGKYLLNEHDFKIDSSRRGYSTDMIDFLNKIIKYVLPEDIVNAVRNSNGYGKRYINYLENNNKLTSDKIELLRLAMIQVPSYLLPVAGGYTLYNLFNNQQLLQYLKQGGKIDTIKFLKNGKKR